MSATSAPAPPKATVRALIADYTPDPPTITPSTDRDLIAKVIRQGGRCVWLDVSYVDSETLAWLSQTLNMPNALLALDSSFYEREPFLVFGLPVPHTSKDGGWGFNSALIAIRGTTLLTLSHGAAAWTEVFHGTERHPSDWRVDFNHTICELLEALVKVSEQVSKDEVGNHVSLNKTLLNPAPSAQVPEYLGRLALFLSSARHLHDRLEPAAYTFSSLSTHPAFKTHQDITWKLLALADRWEAILQSLAQRIEDARDLIQVFSAQQTAQLNARMRGITIALLIALPVIGVALWALILALQTDLRVLIWGVVTIVVVGASLVLGSRAKLL